MRNAKPVYLFCQVDGLLRKVQSFLEVHVLKVNNFKTFDTLYCNWTLKNSSTKRLLCRNHAYYHCIWMYNAITSQNCNTEIRFIIFTELCAWGKTLPLKKHIKISLKKLFNMLVISCCMWTILDDRRWWYLFPWFQMLKEIYC